MKSLILPHIYQPRKYQLPILSALDSGIKRVVWCAHRRSGKDVTILNWCIKRLFQEKGTCFYILPTYSQGKKVIWEEMNNDGLRMIDYFPAQIIESKNQQEMKIRLINGSLFQVIGSDNIDSLVGTNPKIIVFSEYAVQMPAAWDYLRPIVKMNGGYAIFISTPRGKNHFYDLKNIAKDNSETWFYEELPIDKTGVMTHEDFLNEIKTGMSEEKALQEYYVSFDRGIEGAFYGRLIDKAREDKRIGNVGWEPRSNVNTTWDVGFGDSTSVIFWQVVGSEVRIIDFYENQGEGMVHYAKMLQERKYLYGSHFFPHDAGSGSIQTGKTLVTVARELGLNVTVLKRDDISVGIEAARSLLSVCFIDAIKCSHLIKCLENYHKKFNEKTNCYSETPVHDWSSHASDAFRYVAMSRQHYGGSGVSSSLTPDKIREMRQRNLGY